VGEKESYNEVEGDAPTYQSEVIDFFKKRIIYLPSSKNYESHKTRAKALI